MSGSDPDLMKYVVRLLHTLGAAYVVGGSFCLWWVWPRLGTAVPAAQYERGFWMAIGVLAATGVGNLASFGGGLPGPDTRWGGVLLAKLSVVAVLALLSAWRTLLVARDARLAAPGDPRPGVVRALYGATAVLGAGALALAVGLAHP